MFGENAFGSVAFSESAYTPADTSAFEAFLAEISSPRCWLLELDAFSLAAVSAISEAFGDGALGELGFADAAASVTGGVRTLYFSSHGYISQAADTPANTWYDGRIGSTLTVDRRINGRDGIGGLVRVFSQVSLINADGSLDTLTRDYALDGRAARVLIGRPTDARSAFGNVFSGVVESTTIGTSEVTLSLSDGAAKLDVPVNATSYLGTGGTEGGADLKGKPKPRCWGHVYNISPPLVDSANLIYQVNDGPISDVPAVYDRGVALAKVASAPAAGQYSVNVATGMFTLGGTPAGTVTCDVLGDASSSGYVNLTGDIVTRLLNIAGLTAAEIDPTSFSQLNGDAPAEVGIYAPEQPTSISDLVDALLAGVGAFGGFNRAGAFSVGVLAAASGAPRATYSQEDIIEIEREPLPSVVEPVVWRASVGWQKNYTTQSDLAAGVTAARRTFAAEPQRVSKSEDASIRSRHILAMEYGPGDNLYAQQADADSEALRLFNLWSAGRALFRVKTRPPALMRDLGHVVQLQYGRYGLAAGMSGRVIQHSIDGTDVEMRVLV